MSQPTVDVQFAPVRDFFLARQPVLDRNQALFGYQLLFRASATGPANIDTPLRATASVIAHAAHLGLEKVIGDAQGFLNVDAEVINSDIFAFLPRQKVVLEIADAVPVTAALVARIGELTSHGFRFALGELTRSGPEFERLLPMVDFLLLDMRKLPDQALTGLATRFRGGRHKLMALKVETRAQFDTCKALGCDYFQGYYFASPSIMHGKRLAPSQLALLELMTLITSDADNIDIERAVKRDVTLGLNLLRLVNTPGLGTGYRIDSLSQAMMVLGRRQLQRWLQIMLYAEPARHGHNLTPLLMLATTRGRMLELLAQRLRPGQRNIAEVAFTVGIMSLLDTLFGMPMQDIVMQIPVSDEVSAALLQRDGFFGDLLHLAECIERADEMEHQVAPALRELAISADELAALEMAAFEWSDNVVRYAI